MLQNDNSKAIEYIDSIYDGYDIKQIKKYSNNKLINVIVSRYAQLCYNNNIEFSADIRDVNFSFIKDSEITALFDNLFENAFEATKKCPNKFINIEVDYRNENYIFIKMLNSINNKPLFQNGAPITTKKDKKGHGIGIKSILKIVKKYHGNLDYTYIENENIFFICIKKNDVIQIEGPSFSESKHVITAKDCMCEDKFEQYMKEERRYLYERINLLRLFKPGNIGFRDVFFRYSFTVMGFENMVEHCSYNQTRNFIDSRKFTLSEEEIVSCNQWLNDYCNAPYTLLKESIDEFSWGLEQDDTPTGFEQHITALEMTLLPQNQTGKKQMLANRISAMLGNSPAEIQQLYQKVMNFYRFRSESLHEGNDSNITDTELHDLENITREVLKKCLIRCKIEYDLDSSITWNEIKNQIMNDLIRQVISLKNEGILPA